MNCTHCNLELPNDAAFCARCGNPTGNPPSGPHAPHVRLPASAGRNLLIGCACAIGALLFLLITFAFIAFSVSRPQLGMGCGGRCCEYSVPDDNGVMVASSAYRGDEWQPKKGPRHCAMLHSVFCLS